MVIVVVIRVVQIQLQWLPVADAASCHGAMVPWPAFCILFRNKLQIAVLSTVSLSFVSYSPPHLPRHRSATIRLPVLTLSYLSFLPTVVIIISLPSYPMFDSLVFI